MDELKELKSQFYDMLALRGRADAAMRELDQQIGALQAKLGAAANGDAPQVVTEPETHSFQR